MVSHYYGDIERKLFIGGGIAMLVTLPFFNELLPVKETVSLAAILVLICSAGFMNPKQKWSAAVNMMIAALAMVIFGYYTIQAYGVINRGAIYASFFVVNLMLATNFLAAFYYGVKTFRHSIYRAPNKIV